MIRDPETREYRRGFEQGVRATLDLILAGATGSELLAWWNQVHGWHDIEIGYDPPKCKIAKPRRGRRAVVPDVAPVRRELKAATNG